MEDSRIIELYLARQESAIAETASKYGKLCSYIAMNILHCNEDSEECVNDTYLGAWNAIPPQKPNKLAGSDSCSYLPASFAPMSSKQTL